MVRRAAALPGDVVLVTGTIGDGGLGLQAARGELDGLGERPSGLSGRPLPAARAARRPARGAGRQRPRRRRRLGRPGRRRRPHRRGQRRGGPDRPGAAAAVAGGAGLGVGPARSGLRPWPTSPPAGDDYEVVCTADMGGAMRLAMAASRPTCCSRLSAGSRPGEGVLVLHRGDARDSGPDRLAPSLMPYAPAARGGRSAMRPRLILTGILAAALVAAPASRRQPRRARRRSPNGQYVDISPVGLPIVHQGRLINYVFVTVRLNLRPVRQRHSAAREGALFPRRPGASWRTGARSPGWTISRTSTRPRCGRR